jgi:plasmid stabilization system protein ParE
MSIRYLPDAVRELQESVAYYHERNPLAAKRFAEAIRVEERHILEQPQAAPRIAGEWRTWRIPHFPYSLIYRQVGRDVFILAVAHHSRRPGYWKDRLQDIH